MGLSTTGREKEASPDSQLDEPGRRSATSSAISLTSTGLSTASRASVIIVMQKGQPTATVSGSVSCSWLQRSRQENTSQRLERLFNDNQQRIIDARAQLDERLGALKELFGVLQTVSGDAQGRFNT